MEEFLEMFKLTHSYHKLPIIVEEIPKSDTVDKLWVVSYKMLASITEFCLHLGC